MSDTGRRGRITTRARAIVEGAVAAVGAFVLAGRGEQALIRLVRPSESELAWVSDVVIAVALGCAVYAWRHLVMTRAELSELERADLIVSTQLTLAESMQRRLLPAVPPPAHGVEWAASLTPAGRIGGDFYDFVEYGPGRWLVLVADVSGKGVPAAMALGLLRSTFRSLAHEARGPADLARRLSVVLYEEWSGDPYVTCFVADVDTALRRMTCTNAGHPSPLVLHRHGRRLLERGGPPVALVPGAVFEQETVELSPGDTCVIVTDGITEGLDEDEPGAEVIAATVRGQAAPDSAVAICGAVMSRALLGHGPRDLDDWDDDRTVVVIAVRG